MEAWKPLHLHFQVQIDDVWIYTAVNHHAVNHCFAGHHAVEDEDHYIEDHCVAGFKDYCAAYFY
jgi:hypothetical protein